MGAAKLRGGFVFSRLMLVLSSLSPLFLLWAAQGAKIIRDLYFVPICLVLAALPNVYLWWRIWYARREDNLQRLKIGVAEDHRTRLLFYLFVLLLPFYGISFGSWRELFTAIGVLAFIVFIFWHLNLHYINVFFEVFGYHVYTIDLPDAVNPADEQQTYVLISKRNRVQDNKELMAYYLSANVYFETEELMKSQHPEADVEGLGG